MSTLYFVVATDQENNNCDFFVVADSQQAAYEAWMETEFVAALHNEEGAFVSDGEGIRIFDVSLLKGAPKGVIEWPEPVEKITC